MINKKKISKFRLKLDSIFLKLIFISLLNINLLKPKNQKKPLFSRVF